MPWFSILFVVLFWVSGLLMPLQLFAEGFQSGHRIELKLIETRRLDRTDPKWDPISFAFQKDSVEQRKGPRRGIAIALTVLLGPLGGHRLYLGTEPKVPVLYTLTLGGGLGILPLVDLVHLIVKGELDPYVDNRKVFMWIRSNGK